MLQLYALPLKNQWDDTEVHMTPMTGYNAPSECTCVEGMGIAEGCAEHKGMSPAWRGGRFIVLSGLRRFDVLNEG